MSNWHMTLGVRQHKNGSRRGYLKFSTGKVVVLSDIELKELENKIHYWKEAPCFVCDEQLNQAPRRQPVPCRCADQIQIKVVT